MMPIPFPLLAAYGLFAACIMGALLFHGVPALLAGLLSYTLTKGVLRRLEQQLHGKPARGLEWVAALVVGLGSLAALAGVVGEIRHYLVGDSLSALMLTLADNLQHIKRYLPAALANQVPDTLLEAKGILVSALKAHANTLAQVGSSAAQHLVRALIGWIVGVLVGVQGKRLSEHSEPVFSATWRRLWCSLSAAFSRVAYAQAKIATINAVLSAIFLFGVLPLLDWKLPYRTTLVAVTLVFGLLPVVGNLISNVLLCTLALGVSFPAAIVSLVFLVLVHKLEYFLSARVQGQEMGAQAFELLIVLFAAEALFGPAGMVFAPVLYAFATAELRRAGWLQSDAEGAA
jgi:predicted PurR-regulated permease PerM